MSSQRAIPFSLLILLLSLPAFSAPLGRGNLKVRVVYTDDRALTTPVRLQLMLGSSNDPVAEAYANDRGEAEFSGLAVGSYHIVVTGEGIQETDSGIFDVDERKTTQSIMISVKRIGEGEKNRRPGGTVASSDLKIPAEAKLEFDQATSLMSKQSWNEAVPKLQRATVIYPKYVDAYTDLGVVYARLGDSAHERESLNQALAVNDRFVPALLNLGMLEIKERHYPEADALLTRANSADPTNVQVLALLGQCQLLEKHYDAAIASCAKAHAVSDSGFAIVHYIAARAYLHQNRNQDAIAQFQLMLKEEPTGPRADAVRQELTALQGQPR